MNLKTITIAGWLAVSTTGASAQTPAVQKEFGQEYIEAIAENTLYVSKRPQVEERLFRSKAIEKKIKEIKKLLKDSPYLAWMFENCFPNTLDTTVHYEEGADGTPDTFVYTGDIHAMWGRDSGAQVWPYIQFANEDKDVKKMVKGVILRQFKNIQFDPYANAFNRYPNPNSEWMKDD